MSTVEIVLPVAGTAGPAASAPLAARTGPGPQTRLLLLSNGKPKAALLLSMVAAELRQLGVGGTVEEYAKASAAKPLEPGETDRLAAGVTAVLAGLGDCGACSACSVNDATQFELRGIPAVALITEPFQRLTTEFAARLGVPDLNRCVVPHPVASRSQEHLEKLAQESARTIVGQLWATASPESTVPSTHPVGS
jgi:hypothetical protein